MGFSERDICCCSLSLDGIRPWFALTSICRSKCSVWLVSFSRHNLNKLTILNGPHRPLAKNIVQKVQGSVRAALLPNKTPTAHRVPIEILQNRNSTIAAVKQSMALASAGLVGMPCTFAPLDIASVCMLEWMKWFSLMHVQYMNTTEARQRVLPPVMCQFGSFIVEWTATAIWTRSGIWVNRF